MDPAVVVGLIIAGLACLFLFLLYHAILKVAEWTLTARDALRDCYGSSRWQPQAFDLVLLPAWLAIEVFCLAAGLVIGLLLLWAAIDTANSVRDWWHRGNSGH